MKKLILLFSFLLISCGESREIREEKARHQAETGERINQTQKNVEPLFKEIQ